MVKQVSRGQVAEVGSRVLTQVNWDQLDGDRLQTEVINLPSEEFGRRFTAFLKNGAKFIFVGRKVACVPFNSAEFIGKSWAFWKGPKDGSGLEGEEERDKASAAFAEVDFDRADFLTCLKNGENSITGEEKLIRLKSSGRIRYGATVFMGLWENYQACENKGESVLEKLYQQKGITYIDFFGDVLRGQDGHRCVLYLYRDVVGQWDWHCYWLDNGWYAQSFSAVSQQVSS